MNIAQEIEIFGSGNIKFAQEMEILFRKWKYYSRNENIVQEMEK